jgi:hypothetical protein
MNAMKKQAADLTRLLAQTKQSGAFVHAVVPTQKAPSKDDAKKLAQLKMNYDREQRFATPLELTSF